MRTVHTILLSCLAVLLLAACNRDEVELSQTEQPTVITIGAGSRGIGDADGTAEDYYINSLRVLGYRTSNGTLAFNEMALGLPESTANGHEVEKIIDVLAGNFTIVFIANEHSDPALSKKLQDLKSYYANDPVIGNISYLKGQSFSHEAFDKSEDIPMVLIRENVTINADSTLIDPTVGSAPMFKWYVKMIRLGVRVDVRLSINDTRLADWQASGHANKIYFNNVPDRAYIFPGLNNSESMLPVDSKFITLDPGIAPGSPPKVGDANMFHYYRLILPESSNPDLIEAKAVTLKLMEGATPRTGPIKPGTGIGDKFGTNGYTVPRNHYIDAFVRVLETDVTIDAGIMPWQDIPIYIPEIEGPI